MPSKLTKKYRKNNITTKKTKNKRGGKKPKIVSSFLESTMNTISNQTKQLEVSRNSKNPWVDRETNKRLIKFHIQKVSSTKQVLQI